MHSDPTARPIPHEALRRHADSVRALARHLVADEHAAEDVVQDTWVVALENPPPRTGAGASLGGWLRSVTRSLVQKRLRGAERSARRERAASRKEAVPGPEELLTVDERAASLRRLTDAVLTLDEPYRGTVLRRYFEDLAPREIARREGLPVATVKSRLQRALVRLRQGLDDEEGVRWRRDLAALVGIPLAFPPTGSSPATESTAGSPAAPTPGEIQMAGVGKLAVASVLGLAAGAAVWRIALPPDASKANEAAPTAVQDVPQWTSAETTKTETTDGSARVALANGARVAADGSGETANALAAREVRLGIDVVDAQGLPVPGATILAAPLGMRLNHVGTTDGAGRFEFAWLEDAPATELALAVSTPSEEPQGFELLTLGAGESHALRVQAVGARSIELQHVAEGNIAAGSFLLRESFFFRPHEVDTAPQAIFTETGHVEFQRDQTDPDLDLTVHDAAVEERDFASFGVLVHEDFDPDDGEQYVQENVFFDELDATITLERVSDAAVERPEAVDGEASGWVRDAEGLARSGISVAVLTAKGELLRRTSTGEDGAFRFVCLPSGELELRAGGGPEGIASTRFSADSPRPFQWNADLVRGPQISGALRAPTGAGEVDWSGWNVEAAFRDGATHAVRRTPAASDGTFTFPESVAGGAELSVIPPADAPRVPLATLANALPYAPLEPIELQDTDLEFGSLRLQVTDVEGNPLEHATVRVWHTDTRRGTWARLAPHEEGAPPAAVFTHAALPQGFYRVETGAPGFAWTTVERQWLGAGEALDLGQVRLSPAGE